MENLMPSKFLRLKSLKMGRYIRLNWQNICTRWSMLLWMPLLESCSVSPSKLRPKYNPGSQVPHMGSDPQIFRFHYRRRALSCKLLSKKEWVTRNL